MSEIQNVHPITKRCPRCLQVKPLSGFHRNRRSRDGRQGYCIPCQYVARQEWRDRQAAAHRLVGNVPTDVVELARSAAAHLGLSPATFITRAIRNEIRRTYQGTA